jgi:hypothetical protein
MGVGGAGVFLLTVILISGLIVGSANAARITHEPDGFNGYKWGDATTQYRALTQAKDPHVANQLPNVEVYESPEPMVINGVTPNKVYLRFFKGQLGSVELRYQGRENRERLREWLEKQYGSVPPPERKQKHIEWHGENTVVSLGFDPSSNEGRLWIIHLLLSPFDNSAAAPGTSGP